MTDISSNPINILLVEDNPGDADLVCEGFEDLGASCTLQVVNDGEAALEFLFGGACRGDAPHPDLIILDLNLPKKSGWEVLEEIKSSPDQRTIPVIVLSSSRAAVDIHKAYELHANCYISKPMDFDDFNTTLKSLAAFWFETVRLPQ